MHVVCSRCMHVSRYMQLVASYISHANVVHAVCSVTRYMQYVVCEMVRDIKNELPEIRLYLVPI